MTVAPAAIRRFWHLFFFSAFIAIVPASTKSAPGSVAFGAGRLRDFVHAKHTLLAAPVGK
jgi:hypothetical protein